MKRLILTVFVFIMCSVSAFAADTLTANIYVENDLIKGSVAVDGAGASEVVSVRVLDENGEYNFADILYTDKNGEATFEYINLGATGTYAFTAYAPKQNEKVNIEFKYYDQDYRNLMILEFNKMCLDRGSASEYIKKYSGALDISEYYSEISDTVGFDEMLLNLSVDASEVGDINKMLNDTVLPALVNEKHSSELLKKMFSDEKFAEYSNFISDSNGKSLLNSMNSDIQNAFYKSVADGNYISKQKLIEAEKTFLLTKGIENSSLSGETKTLIEAYKNKGWLSLSESQDMDKVCQYLTGKAYIDISAVEAAYNNYKEQSGNTPSGGSSGGGSGGGSKNSSVLAFNPPADKGDITEKEQLFSDVELTMWAEKAIRKCVENGILTGMGDGNFNPTGKLTRAQAAVILFKLAKLEKTDKAFGYTDVNADDWYADYVNAVTDAGLFYGISGDEFGVNQILNREQAVTVFWRYLKVNGAEAKENQYTFDDDGKISDWARDAVSALVELGIISGKTDKLFAPEQPLLRSEAAVIISNILNFVNRE